MHDVHAPLRGAGADLRVHGRLDEAGVEGSRAHHALGRWETGYVCFDPKLERIFLTSNVSDFFLNFTIIF